MNLSLILNMTVNHTAWNGSDSLSSLVRPGNMRLREVMVINPDYNGLLWVNVLLSLCIYCNLVFNQDSKYFSQQTFHLLAAIALIGINIAFLFIQAFPGMGFYI